MTFGKTLAFSWQLEKMALKVLLKNAQASQGAVSKEAGLGGVVCAQLPEAAYPHFLVCLSTSEVREGKSSVGTGAAGQVPR